MQQKTIIKGKTAFYLFIFVCTIVILSVWITGIDIHRTITNNAIYSLTIITALFFSFVTFGLYRGIGMTDNFSGIKGKVGYVEPSGFAPDIATNLPIGEFASEGVEGIIVVILMWIAMLIISIALTFFFETILLVVLISFTAALYWVFYRASMLILRYSRLTKNNLLKSMWIGFKYSLMYSGWIYLIIWTTELLKN